MKILLPKNIFTELIENAVSQKLKDKLIFKPASLITSEIQKTENSAGLIPTMDLIKNIELFISGKYGISFEGSLCNSYIYFNPGQKKFDEINLFGDISSTEAILSKILFKELYDSDIQIQIATDENKMRDRNFIITGDVNFKNDRFFSGISFSEEIIELLSLPFVNYVFASKEKQIIEELNKTLKGLSQIIYQKVEEGEFGKNLSLKSKDYFRSNISSVVIDFVQNDIDGIAQLIRLPYFHGIINEIIEPKFV